MELFEFIEDLRLQMQAAANARRPKELAFLVNKIELEVSIVVEAVAGGKLAYKMLTLEQSEKKIHAHKLKLELMTGEWNGTRFTLSSSSTLT